ncbi:S8 family serine peptidase [Haloplanus salilacus]|uniref:S8 family serine peptidase n=1 Tax=Haloplanus salilacus TaxID=2949994 RepID=UPI0030D316F4
MSNALRIRIVVLAVLVVLATVQPAPAPGGDRAPDASVADAGSGTAPGPAAGATVNRHPSSGGATADALRTVRADAVHAEGLTGRDVDVGVVGRGFDAGALSDRVAARRQVGDRPGATAHDTAVAEVVAETAPSSDLYLAGVGRTPTPAEYAAAVDWLTDRGVDVIVDSGSYFPSVAADERRITAAATRATDRGVVFVTSAGNYANRHWAGEGSPTADGWVDVADGTAANPLAAGERLRGRVTLHLRWRSGADYDLYLYRRLPDAPDRVVAKSTADATGPGLTVERIDVAVPRGRYYVAVYADDPVQRPGRVQVFAARHELGHTTARGSMVAPATSDRVVAVGASADGEPLPYSSRAETGGVDVLAPGDARTSDGTLAGTSAAAPYVAGTAALMKSGGRDLSPDEVESILERTAADEDGRLDALAAVEAARDPTAPRDATATDRDERVSPADSRERATQSDGVATARDGTDAAGAVVESTRTSEQVSDDARNTTRTDGTDDVRNATRSGGRDDAGRPADTESAEDDGTDGSADDGSTGGTDPDRERNPEPEPDPDPDRDDTGDRGAES